MRTLVAISALAAILPSAVANDSAHARESYRQIPLSFEENRGQSRSSYAFVARAAGYSVLIGRAESTFIVGRDVGQQHRVRMRFENASTASPAKPLERLPGTVNYLRGSDPKNWHTGVATFKRVMWPSVYPGIDVVYYGNGRQLEYDLVLAPGADPARVTVAFEGARSLRLDAAGNLHLQTQGGSLTMHPPAVYQQRGGRRKPVAARYRVAGNRVKFDLAQYDRTIPLVIDPTLSYSALVGGSNSDSAEAVAVDGSGNAYVAGVTSSSDYPTTPGVLDSGLGLSGDAFVTKLDASGAVIYSTFYGGAGYDRINAIAVDSSGNVHGTGETSSNNLPLVNAARQRSGNLGSSFSSFDAFAFKLAAAGNVLLYSTYLGGSNHDAGRGIAVDSANNTYVTGSTDSSNFYTTPGTYQPLAPATPFSSTDAFVVKLNSSGTISYATFVGSTGTDQAYAVSVDSAQHAYIAGYTTGSAFPGAPAFGGYTGDGAFVAKLNPAGSAVLFATRLRGTGTARAIALDATGAIYFAGTTNSSELPLTTGRVQPSYGGSGDGFVAKLSSAGDTFLYVTYLGGRAYDAIYGLAVDGNGRAAVTGETRSSDYPIFAPLQRMPGSNMTALFSTGDGGATWTADTTLPGSPYSVSVDPLTASTLVVGTDFGIFRSTNSGLTWTQVSELSDAKLVRAPSSPGVIYATAGSSVRRSLDNGSTWSFLIDLPGCCATAAAVSATDSNTVYIGTHNGLWRTTSGGGTWISSNAGLPANVGVTSVVGSQDGTVYVLASGGLYKSTNGGQVWSLSSSGLPLNSLNKVATCPGDSQSLIASAAGQVYKSSDAGANWTAVPIGLPGRVGFGAPVFGPPNCSHIYVPWLDGTAAMLRSNDGGATWSGAGTALGVAQIDELAVAATNANVVYAGSRSSYADAFITKLNTDATGFIYSTYLGGSQHDRATAVAFNAVGDAFIAGEASPNGFPLHPSPPVTARPGSTNAFVVKISDATANCASLLVSPSTYFGYGSGQTAFNVIAPSGCAWTATAGNPWITIVDGASGTGTGKVTAYLDNNPGGARTGSISVAGRTITVEQPGPGCGVFVSGIPNSLLPATGGLYSAVVSTGPSCKWSVSNFSPGAVAVTGSTSGTGSGAVSFTVSPNTASVTRNLDLRIGGSYLRLTQATACSVVVSPAAVNFPHGGGTANLTVSAPPGCGWNVYSDASWLTPSGINGSGSAEISFTAAASAGSPRAATIRSASNGQTTTRITQGGSLAALGPGRFVPVTPCRIADTRNSNGPFGGPAVAAGSLRSFAVPSSGCGIPDTALAYSVNVTAVPHRTLGYLTVFSTGEPVPLASTLNSVDGRTKANAAIVPAGTGGAISVYATDTTDVILDINGYFVAFSTPSTLAFFPLLPCRVADTRSAGSSGLLSGGQTRSFPVRSSSCGIPPSAQAYALNFTAVPRGFLGYLSVWPAGLPMPLASTLNAQTGQVTANAAIVPAGVNGDVNVFASNATDVVIDINGYFAPFAPGGLSLYHQSPCRVLDTRLPANSPSFSGVKNVIAAGSSCAVPMDAQAYVFNATVVPSGLLGYLSLWPSGQAQPLVSTLNALDGAVTSNMAIVPAANGSISAFSANPTHLVLDVMSYFAP